MSRVTKLLQSIEAGDPQATDHLLPIVYDELRKLARQRLANERPGNTLQATALVHEAYVRLVGNTEVDWSGSGHFFGAAAEAMRRILIERARQRATQKHGGNLKRVDLDSQLTAATTDQRLVELDEALSDLEEYDQRKAQVVKLRFFAGLTNKEVAAVLGVSTNTTDRDWTFAKAWLHNRLSRHA